MSMVKFSSQMDADVLERLRAFARANERQIGPLLSEAVAEYLQRAQIRPAFQRAVDEVIEQHDDLLRRLAR
jgi:predicted transcriptional regulator